MVTQEQRALIHAELDGELSAGQRAELARCLLADPEARALHQDLKRLGALLEQLGEVDPPERLRPSILAALPQSRSKPLLSARGWRYAAIAAGFVVAAAAVFETVRGVGPSPTDMVGTMAPAPGDIRLDSAELEEGPVLGQVSLLRGPQGLRLELKTRSSAPVDLVITGGGHTLRLSGLEIGVKAGGPPARVALPGFDQGVRAVDLAFVVSGRPVGHATLRIPERP